MQGVNRNGATEEKPGWKRLALLVVCWMVILSLARDLALVQKGFDRVEETDKRLAKEEAKSADLRLKLGEAQTDYYREMLMREKLNLQKPGEIVVVMTDRGVTAVAKEEKEVRRENWMKWWDLLR